MKKQSFKLLATVSGIYITFLTWSLIQEPLNTNIWPNSQSKFQYPCVINISQALVATIIGWAYLSFQGSDYNVLDFLKNHCYDIVIISLTQASSSPLALYSLEYVDYLTYMLAKSCKLIPILIVHILFYRTSIPKTKKIVAGVVTIGVTLFTLGGPKKMNTQSTSLYGFLLLFFSLFLDGLTNATQDTLLKRNVNKKITGAHLMFALNFAIILWNIGYILLFKDNQWKQPIEMIFLDPEILKYLFTYAICGALGQCFIFYTLEQYGSLLLVMITVTRKMMSMLLSIILYGHTVTFLQWLGIIAVFGGIILEAKLKRQKGMHLDKNKKE